jgi:hypothetical protein
MISETVRTPERSASPRIDVADEWIPPDPSTVESLRAHCEHLVTTEGMDKPTVLGIMRLQHGMETMLLRRQFERDKEINRLGNELAMVHVTHRNTEMLQSLQDCVKLKSTVNGLEAARG